MNNINRGDTNQQIINPSAKIDSIKENTEGKVGRFIIYKKTNRDKLVGEGDK